MRVLQKALTFDDVLLVPAHSAILPREVSLSTQLTRTITLNLPLLSAVMDTVTEARLAIALAQEGGIGINFAIKEAFEKQGIEMAYPTSTVYVKQLGSTNNPIKSIDKND